MRGDGDMRRDGGHMCSACVGETRCWANSVVDGSMLIHNDVVLEKKDIAGVDGICEEGSG